MINGKTISLVVPCRNEARIIGTFIKKVPSYVDEICIVDNGSTDDSAIVAKKSGATVVTEKRTVNGIGYGFAHQTGMNKATGDYIVAMDGDDTYPVRSIKKIICMMEKKQIDVVSCNRLPLTNTKVISPIRQFGIHILNLEARLFFGYSMNDILTGMWVIRKTAIKELRATSGDWNFSPEIKINALMNPALSFCEYHINHFARAKEPSKQQIWKTGFSHVVFLLKKRVELWRVELTTLSRKFQIAQ
jgi:glycosyltransferase involved in cell wall biosynthesis